MVGGRALESRGLVKPGPGSQNPDPTLGDTRRETSTELTHVPTTKGDRDSTVLQTRARDRETDQFLFGYLKLSIN